ncbi:hypothetical protein Taro_035521 [Colocasia esculenta]|uniref:Uncharacterized protein n=1 Tax=Colocasia esculenta TaxID=4460 RepID=A0A843WDF9_COLES|nr:hypothetical protein [Colocasia esculenta]
MLKTTLTFKVSMSTTRTG